MATRFTSSPQTTEWPDQPVAPVGQALARLFESGSDQEWRDVRGLFVEYASYEQTRFLVADQLNELPNAECQTFLRAFTELLVGFEHRWSEWKLVLGSVAEEAFRTLLAEKYREHGNEYLEPEGCPHLYAAAAATGTKPKATMIATMGKKSMDAICWDKARDCGEMHEVKASILNFEDRKKAVVMREFKQALLGQTQGEVWFGFSGFFDPLDRAIERIRTLLGLLDTDEPLILDILVPENYRKWRGKSYLEVG